MNKVSKVISQCVGHIMVMGTAMRRNDSNTDSE